MYNHKQYMKRDISMDIRRFFEFLDDKANIGPKLEKIARIMFWIGFIAFAGLAVFTLFGSFAAIRYSFGSFIGGVFLSAVVLVVGYFVSYLSYIASMALAKLVTNSERIANATEWTAFHGSRDTLD